MPVEKNKGGGTGFLASCTKLNLSISLFVVLLGLQLVLPSALFAASSNVKVTVCNNEPTNPTISSPHSLTVTDQPSILLSGDAMPDAIVEIFRNSSNIGFVTASSDGSYSISAGLVAGTNILQAKITDDCGRSASSDPITVIYNNPPPAPTPSPAPASPAFPPNNPGAVTNLPQASGTSSPTTRSETKPGSENRTPSSGKIPVIFEPKNGITTSQPSVLVRSQADSFVTLRVFRNDKLVAEVLTDGKGWISASIPLVKGKNYLVVVVGQGSQEIRSKTTTITYIPPGAAATQPQNLTLVILLTLVAAGIVLLSSAFLLDVRRRRRQDKS